MQSDGWHHSDFTKRTGVIRILNIVISRNLHNKMEEVLIGAFVSLQLHLRSSKSIPTQCSSQVGDLAMAPRTGRVCELRFAEVVEIQTDMVLRLFWLFFWFRIKLMNWITFDLLNLPFLTPTCRRERLKQVIGRRSPFLGWKDLKRIVGPHSWRDVNLSYSMLYSQHESCFHMPSALNQTWLFTLTGDQSRDKLQTFADQKSNFEDKSNQQTMMGKKKSKPDMNIASGYLLYIGDLTTQLYKLLWGFIKKPGLSVTYSWQIGFWEHDIEASKMQGRARGRKGERKTYHITILYIQISCMYLIDYLYHILPFCLARWSLSRSVEAFVFKKCPACSLVMWHVEWRIVPSGVSIGRRMLAVFLPRKSTI